MTGSDTLAEDGPVSPTIGLAGPGILEHAEGLFAALVAKFALRGIDERFCRNAEIGSAEGHPEQWQFKG